MKASEVLKLAWKALTSNPLRSLLTMLGIIIGVAAVIVMISISSGTEAAIEAQITGLGSNLIYVQSSFGRGIPGQGAQSGGLVFDDANAISEEVSGVSGVVVEQGSSQTVKAGNIALDAVEILGTTPGMLRQTVGDRVIVGLLIDKDVRDSGETGGYIERTRHD